MDLKQQILESMQHEVQVIKHLATKVPDGGLEYRPSEPQRSTLDLLQYLTCCAIMPITAAINANWDHAEAMKEAAANVTADGFAAAMDAQMAALSDILAPLTDADLVERTAMLPWGEEVGLGRALLMNGLKPLTAYRMQLFLYCKAAGNTGIDSRDCWAGVDAPPSE